VRGSWLSWLGRRRPTEPALPSRLPFVNSRALPPPTVFLLQIVDRTGCVARLPAGGALEEDLVAFLSAHILTQLRRPSAGSSRLERWVLSKLPWRSIEAALAAAVHAGIPRALSRLKAQTVHVAHLPQDRAELDAAIRSAWKRQRWDPSGSTAHVPPVSYGR